MQPSILFIPDISGFTKFVNETEINHSQHIINELINVMIEANQINLNVAEIEGDAIFFYKTDDISLDQIRSQAQKIYIDFHTQVKKYATHRICNCGACSSAVNLKIKFVVHHGPVTLLQYSNLEPKPHGKDVVAVHRLLKNNIRKHEYILYSDKYLESQPSAIVDSGSFTTGEIEDAELGKIEFKFEDIEAWHEEVPSSEEVKISDDKKNLILELDIVVDAKIEDVHELIVDFRHRHLWNKGVQSIEFNEEEINRIGSEHYCLVNGNRVKFETINAKGVNREFTYGEKVTEGSPFKEFKNYFLLEPAGPGRTKINLELYGTPKNVFQRFLLFMIKPRISKNTKKLLSDIKEVGESFRNTESSILKNDESVSTAPGFHLHQTHISN